MAPAARNAFQRDNCTYHPQTAQVACERILNGGAFKISATTSISRSADAIVKVEDVATAFQRTARAEQNYH